MRITLLWYACLILLASLLTAASPAAEEQQTQTDCCFMHEAYQGVCRVTPAEGETCESILEYLNTPGTVGKTYCENTRLRGSWAVAECPEEEANVPESGASDSERQR